MHGRAEVMAQGPPQMGWAIDWLADGRLATTGPAVTRQEPDGTSVMHCERGGNEIAIDPSGHMCVNGFDFDFDFLGGGPPRPGWINLIALDGSYQQVAGDIEFPNGMVVTPDGSTLVVSESFAGRLSAFDIQDDGTLPGRRVWAEGLGPDGICIDARGRSGRRPPIPRRTWAMRVLQPARAYGCSTVERSRIASRPRCLALRALSEVPMVGTCSCCATSSKVSIS